MLYLTTLFDLNNLVFAKKKNVLACLYLLEKFAKEENFMGNSHM